MRTIEEWMGEILSFNQSEQAIPFDKESIEHLSSEKREDMIRLMIKQMLKQHPEGITASDLSEISGLSVITVRKHLDFLTAIREAYDRSYRGRLTIYFPNGRLVHPYSDSILEAGSSIFSFQRVENAYGSFIYIQERKKDLYTNKTRTVGGIMIGKDNVDELLDKLREVAEEWKKDDEGTGRIKIGR